MSNMSMKPLRGTVHPTTLHAWWGCASSMSGLLKRQARAFFCVFVVVEFCENTSKWSLRCCSPISFSQLFVRCCEWTKVCIMA